MWGFLPAQAWGGATRDKKKNTFIFKVNVKSLQVFVTSFLITLILVVVAVGVVMIQGQRTKHRIAFSKDQEWRLKSIAPRDWNAVDVQAWAADLGLGEFMPGFKRSSVDGELLLSITESEIRSDLKVYDNLLVKKLLQHVAKLKGGSYKPPGTASGQALIRDEHEDASGAPKPMSVASRSKKISVYRVWESMLEESKLVVIQADRIKSVSQLTDIIGDRIAETSPEGEHGVSAVLSREGNPILDMGIIPDKVFALVGKELFFFPDDKIGERFSVRLPTDDRSVEVEVVSSHPRLLLVPNFLSPTECEEIMQAAKPALKPSTVLATGDQSKVLFAAPSIVFPPCLSASLSPSLPPFLLPSLPPSLPTFSGHLVLPPPFFLLPSPSPCPTLDAHKAFLAGGKVCRGHCANEQHCMAAKQRASYRRKGSPKSTGAGQSPNVIRRGHAGIHGPGRV